MKISNHKLQQALAQTYQLIQQGRSQQAIAKLTPLLAAKLKNADVYHLAALAHKANSDNAQAKKYFLASLKQNANQAEVHNNLANLYRAQENHSLAEKHYRQAVSIKSDYWAAQHNLALCLNQQHEYQSSVDILKTILQAKPNDVTVLTTLADSYRGLTDYAQAKTVYTHALGIASDHINAWHNLGLCHHFEGDLQSALKCYEKAYHLSPNQAEIVQSFAMCQHELGHSDTAVKLLQQYLAKNPATVFIHERLNDLLWEMGDLQLFSSSYRQAIILVPSNLELHAAYISLLFKAQYLPQAVNALEQAMSQFGEQAELLSLNGQLQAEQGNYAAAVESFEHSLKLEFSGTATQQLIKLQIVKSDYLAAQRLIDKLFTTNPDCQLTWSLQSLVWRLSDDERYFWLNDYDRFVNSYTLDVPEGYSSLGEYLTALTQCLDALHKAERAPLEQTLRNGSQTRAKLLDSNAPEIVVLKKNLSSIVAEYIESLPDDSSHPLLSRKSSTFEFSGSWSVKLHANGFHVNHVHPQGWISSSCYISLPQSMAGEESNQGCIKFGESPLQLQEREVVELTIKPTAGMVVLFPSYMWHGTIAFEGEADSFRLTAPFDVTPL